MDVGANLFLTFHGEFKGSKQVFSNIHESPISMLFPLFFLAIGAVLSGWFFVDLFVGKNWDDFWEQSLFILAGNDAFINSHFVPKWVKSFPIVLAIIGISIATIFYVLIPDLPIIVSKKFKPIYLLFFNKWYFDEIYTFIFVKPTKLSSIFLWKIFDKKIIDGFGPDGVSSKILKLSRLSSKLHSGYVFHYSFGMFVGLTSLILIFYYSF